MNWLRKFMYGRYGVDELSVTLIIIGFIISILSSFVRITPVIYIIILVLAYYRVLSKSINKRYLENQKFLKLTEPMRKAIRNLKKQTNSLKIKIKNRKKYKYLKCKKCGQKVRVPKGKGKIKVTCPKCLEKTIIKS